MPNAPSLDRQFRPIIDASPDGVLIELRHRIAYINDAYCHLLGYRSARDLLHAEISDIAHADDHDRLTYFGRCREEGKPAPERYEFRARRRDRSTVTFDASVSATRAAGDLLIATFVRKRREPEPKRTELIEVRGLKRLSPREVQIFRALIAGKRGKELALELEVSAKTVATHRSRLFRKLALRNDLDLFRFAARYGLLDDVTPC